MKKIVLLLLVTASMSISAQTKTELVKHFEAYYKQMKSQGDVQGIINAMTHLDVLNPSQARKDTLAYIYASEGRNIEALNTIGVEKNSTDSDINVEVKAIALKSLNQPKRALEHYEVLFQRQPNPQLAYEIADLKIQTQDLPGAKASIEYGLANVKDDMVRTYYETQQPYQTSLKAGFLYLKALVLFNEDKVANVESALATMNRALAIDPNFNLARISKEALLKIKKE
ncbi:tetratricopeptide repeat protein [Geojedonia litorea]|uniref:Tetratricopeptide repeat protein n=1 Tax=Geojedonia litorea TaxID=1268269 RepID=A0ABV9N3W4_9FLAO